MRKSAPNGPRGGRSSWRDPSTDDSKSVVHSDEKNAQSLWSVASDGSVRRLGWPPPGEYAWTFFGEETGSDRMTPSPDGNRVAYVDKKSLKIRELATGKDATVHPTVAATEVGILGWSADGHQLLYAKMLHPPPPPNAEADVFGDDATYVRYDVETGERREIELPGIYSGWLPTGEIVVVKAGGLKLVAAGKGTSRTLTTIPSNFHQVSVSADGTHIAAITSSDGSVIVDIDVPAAKTTVRTTPTPFAEQQWPQLSPRSHRLAYLRTTRLPLGRTTSVLVVEGRELPGSASSALLGFDWLDEHAIVLKRADGLLVVDADTGEVRNGK